MKKLLRWTPELAAIGLIFLTVWILDSRERIETVRAWAEMALTWFHIRPPK